MTSLCLICGDRGTSDAILNVVLFLPLGFLLGGRPRALWAALLTGVTLSGAIELAQLALPGRYPTLGDIVWNGLGAALGVMAYTALHRQRLALPRSAWPGSLAAVAVVLWVALAGWLLAPKPTQERYWGQWTPDLGYMPQYGGTLLAAELNGAPFPKAEFPRARRPRPQEQLAGDWELTARVRKGPPPRGVSPIVSIYDVDQQEILLLGADEEDVVLRERTRAKALRMDHPDLRLAGGLERVAAGQTLALGARRAGTDRCLSVAEVETCGLGFTPGRTWSLLLYLEGPAEPVRRGTDALWMLSLLVPVGLFSGSSRAVLANWLITCVGVLTAVALTRLGMPPWWEVVGGVAGLMVGWLVARRLTTGPAERTRREPA